MKKIIFLLSLIIYGFSFGQTKTECIEYLKTAERVLNDRNWIETNMVDNNLILINYDTYGDFKIVKKEQLDMSKVQSVAIKKSNEYYQIFIYFTGDFHNVSKYEGLENFKKENPKFGYGFKNNWINIYSIKDKERANKIQSYLVKLAELQGSKVVSF